MHEIDNADREWDPDEGDELVGRVWDIGWDKETGKKALNIKPVDSKELVRVWRWEKGLAREWDEVELREDRPVRITYLGMVQLGEEGPPVPRYKVEMPDT